jgi:hypothetical protein
VVIKPEPEHFVEVKRELAGPRGTQHGDNGHLADEEDVSDHFERDSQEGYSHEEEGHHDADSYDDGYYGHEDGQYHSNDEGHSGDHSVDEDQSSNQFASNLNQGTNGRGSAHLSQNHSRPNHGLGNHQNRAQPRANPSQTSEQQREAPMSRSMIVHGAPTGHQVGHETTVRNSNNAQFSDTQQQRIESSSNPRNQGDRFGNSQASNGQKDPEGRQVDGNMTSSESQILRNQAVLQMVNSYLKVPTGYRNPYNSVVYQKQIFADRKDLLPTDKEFAYSSYGGGFGEYKHPLTDIKVPGIIAHKEASHYTSMLGLRESLQSAQKLNVQGKAREEYDYSQTAPKVVDQGLLSYH